MTLKTKQKNALQLLGIELTEYIIDYDYKVHDIKAEHIIPYIWGKTLTKDGRFLVYIEHQPNDFGTNWRWYLRLVQGDPTSTLSIHKTLRESLAAAVKLI